MSEGSRGPARREPGGWRERVEDGFESWGRLVCRFRGWTLLLCAAVTLLCASFLPGLSIDNSTEAFLLPDDPAVVRYNALRDEYSRDDRLLVAIHGAEIFERSFLERLRALHSAIEEQVPYVAEVQSLVNARVTRGEGDVLVVGELLEEWPESGAEIARAREVALANPLYRNTLLSESGRVTALVIEPQTYSSEGEAFDPLLAFESAEGEDAVYLTAPEGTALVVELKRVLAEHEGPGFELHLAGPLAMTHRLNVGMTADLMLMIPITLAVMGLLLALLFRRVSGVLLPLVIVVVSLLNTLGIMVMLGIPGSTAVQILPIFLLTVGVCDAVHILTIAYRLRGEGMAQDEAIARAVGHSGLAVLMTSLTTAAGMASFTLAQMLAVVHLGILAPIGILIALVLTLTLLPALLSSFPMPPHRAAAVGPSWLERFLLASGDFALRSPVRVLVPTALFVVLLVLGALQVRFSSNSLTWFDADDEIRIDFAFVDESLGGSVSADIVVDGGRPGALYEPELLRGIERIMEQSPRAARDPVFVGKATSIVDVVKETHQALSGGDPEARRIPETRAAVAQELLLFEQGSLGDTEEWVDADYRTARVSLRVPFVDAVHFVDFAEELDALVTRELAGKAEHHVTGLLTLLTGIMVAVIDSMKRSYAVALLVITPLMMLLLGSLRRGLVSMFPNLIPPLAALGAFGWSGVALDSTTMMVGAMVVGLAVDDTIHFMHKFQCYFEERGDFEEAVRETLRTTGAALLVTTLVISAGFAMFGFAGMANSRAFGLVAAFACVVAFVADLLVAPALLSLLHRYTGALRGSVPVLQGSSTTLKDSESLAANANASAAESSG